MAAAEVGELEPVGRRDEDVAGIPVPQRRPGSAKPVWMVDDPGIAARLPAAGLRPEAQLLAHSAGDRMAVLEEQGHVDPLVRLDARRELPEVERTSGE